MYKVTVWNEDIERVWNIITDTKRNARNRAIKNELELGTPLYKIHIEKIERV